MSRSLQKVIIVDGYSTGSLFAPRSRERGYEPVHLRSVEPIPKDYMPSFRPEDYVADLVHRNDIESSVQAVRALAPVCVIAGTDLGVELTDAISERLGLVGNGTRQSSAKRDKYFMIEAVRTAGLLAADQALARDPDALSKWCENQNRWPVVVKPTRSGGTDDVYFCRDAVEVRAAFKATIGKVNRLGTRNDAVLAQTFLEGPEFLINTVSREGRHFTTELMRYRKVRINGRDRVYDYIEFVPFHGPEHERIERYFSKVLDAVGVLNGPVHGEVILTPEGPALVELGARCAGARLPILSDPCTGYDQVRATLDAYLDPTEFFARTERRGQLRKYGRMVYLMNSHRGRPTKPFPLERFGFLGSFVHAAISLSPTEEARPTVDCYTTPGLIYLAHESADKVEEDYRAIRAIEAEGLYEELGLS